MMELATFSDIEFACIAADRHVIIGSIPHKRGDSCSSGSTISLASVDSEVERHDQTLSASAFDIHEVYTADPCSPSAFVVDLAACNTPDLIAMDRRLSGDEFSLMTLPAWAGTPGYREPLERYRVDSQRHERVAVSMALTQAYELDASDTSQSDAVFKRSSAPSPPTVRDFGATGSQDRVLTDVVEPVTMGIIKPEIKSGSSLSLGPIEPDPAVAVDEDRDTDESIQALATTFKRSKARLGATRYRTHRPSRQRKRKDDEEHREVRPGSPSIARLSD